jgi:predicted lipid-binding transport protein (Tim44 family)
VKKLLVAIFMMASVLSLVAPDAQARRFGGGSSFGRRAPSFSRPAPAPSPNQFSNANQANRAAPGQPAATPKPASPWRQMLGGALLGLGLGALLSHFGMGGAMAGMLGMLLTVGAIALALMLLMRLFRGKSSAGLRSVYAGDSPSVQTPEIGSRIEPHMPPALLAGSAADTSAAPADFDAPAFLRSAKTYFIRLQAAWDRADINDIREFTTPEMFGELRLQLQERGAALNHTDVVTLDAEMIGVEAAGDEYIVSVRFSGTIKEAEQAPAEPFTEIWNLTKPASGQGGWILAGIQQLS